MLVKLFQDIGELCVHFGQKEMALLHFQLVRLIRTENNWPIPPSLDSAIQIIEKENPSISVPQEISSCLRECKKLWLQQDRDSANSNSKREVKKDIRGRISIVSNRPICFINSRDGLSAICFQNELQSAIQNDDIVLFDAEPSFDRKKNCESWRAVRVRRT